MCVFSPHACVCKYTSVCVTIQDRPVAVLVTYSFEIIQPAVIGPAGRGPRLSLNRPTVPDK